MDKTKSIITNILSSSPRHPSSPTSHCSLRRSRRQPPLRRLWFFGFFISYRRGQPSWQQQTARNHSRLQKPVAEREKAAKLTNRLIHTQYQTSRLHCRLHSIHLHQTRLPHKRLHIIPDALIFKVHSRPHVSLTVLDAQLRKDVGGVEARVVAQLARDDLEGFGEGFDDGLLFAVDGEVGVAVQVGGDFHLAGFGVRMVYGKGGKGVFKVGRNYLAGTASSNYVFISYCSFYDHNGVVETTLHFCDKLLGTSSQYQGASLCCWTSLKEVESFATYLSLVESLASP